MQKVHKDESYHESAIQYNDELAKFAGLLAEQIEHPEVQRWCRSVSKQHQFHLGRHQKALWNLQNTEETTTLDNQDEGIVVTTYEGQSLADFESDTTEEPEAKYRDAGTGEYVSEEYAEENPNTTVRETVVEPEEARVIDDIPPSAVPVENVPDTELAATPVDAGVGTPEDPNVAFARAQADAAAAAEKIGDNA